MTCHGDADTLRIVWSSSPFNDCNFSVLTPESGARAAPDPFARVS
jgi:hypothetical protein